MLYIYTGLPTTDETLDTIVRNLNCFLIFTISVKCKLVCFFAKSLNKELDYYS